MCRLQGKIFTAFTLAEILITLAVIGIVAVLTIPGLIKNHNEKAWATAQSVFEKRLEVATKQMNTEEKLAGYSSTMDFVNELKKYIKITRVCDNSEITKCFNKQVIWNEGEDPIDMSTIRNAASLGQDDWDTDTVAVQFANGVNAIIAYNPNTTQEPFNNQFSATSNSMAILYDVSGYKKPNTIGKDINNINVEKLAGVKNCLITELADSLCITKILSPSTYGYLSYSSCTQAKADGKIDLNYCYNKDEANHPSQDHDYYAGAVKACGGKKANLPSVEQLRKLQQYLYTEKWGNVTLNTDKAAPFYSVAPRNDYFYIWASEESKLHSTLGLFDLRSYNIQGQSRNAGFVIAVCVSNDF